MREPKRQISIDTTNMVITELIKATHSITAVNIDDARAKNSDLKAKLMRALSDSHQRTLNHICYLTAYIADQEARARQQNIMSVFCSPAFSPAYQRPALYQSIHHQAYPEPYSVAVK